jgi:hypothetical protein
MDMRDRHRIRMDCRGVGIAGTGHAVACHAGERIGAGLGTGRRFSGVWRPRTASDGTAYRVYIVAGDSPDNGPTRDCSALRASGLCGSRHCATVRPKHHFRDSHPRRNLHK